MEEIEEPIGAEAAEAEALPAPAVEETSETVAPDLPSSPGADDWPDLTPGTVQVLGPYAVPGLGARRIRIYLPAAFDPAVPWFGLYLFDGQNAFDDGPSFAGGWHTHVAIERLARAGKMTPIAIGIDHGGVERIHELSPFPIQGNEGGLDPLLDWIFGSLRPALEERLPLVPGPAGAAVAGSSMGGLAAVYAHFRRPEEIGGAIAMSPSLWVADGEILDWVADQPRPPFSRVYLDAGLAEGRGTLLPLVAQLAAHLANRGYRDDQLRFLADPKGLHNEKCWRRRLPAALRFLYR